MLPFWQRVFLVVTMTFSCGLVFAQTPPTATEAFNLRIKCKQMGDEKAESLEMRPMTASDGASMGFSAEAVEAMNKNLAKTREVVLSSHASKYDAKNNRCYIEIFQRDKYGSRKENERDIRQIYDAQTDDLLAFAQIINGKKVGMVFDRDHRSAMGSDLGWDDASTYIDEMMAEKRR